MTVSDLSSSLSYTLQALAYTDTTASSSISTEDFTTDELEETLESQSDTLGSELLTTANLEGGQSTFSSALSQELLFLQDNETSFASPLNSNENDTITESDFLSARPDNISEEMAQNLWNKLDSSNTGEISTDILQSVAESKPAGGPPPPPSSSSGTTEEDDDDDSSLISSLDTNGDGYISADELLAASSESEGTAGSGSDENDALQAIIDQLTQELSTTSQQASSFNVSDFRSAVKNYNANFLASTGESLAEKILMNA